MDRGDDDDDGMSFVSFFFQLFIQPTFPTFPIPNLYENNQLWGWRFTRMVGGSPESFRGG